MTEREQNLTYVLNHINNCVDGLARALILKSFDSLSYSVACRRVKLHEVVKDFLEIDKGQEYSKEELEKLDEKYAQKALDRALTWERIFQKKEKQEQQ